MSETKGVHVLKGLAAVQTELAKSGIAKDMKNSGQGWKFRGVDQVLTTLAGLLAINDIQISVHTKDLIREPKSESNKMNTTIVRAEYVATSLRDGSSHSLGMYAGEGADPGDKATSKAHSMSFKYAAFLGFCIPLEGVLDDADSDNPADEPSKAPSKPQEAPKADKATKAAPEEKKAAKEPTAPAKGTHIDTALERIEAVESLDAAEALAMELRGLKSDERFGEVKVALKAKIAELQKESE